MRSYTGSGQSDRQQAVMALQPSKLILRSYVLSDCCARVRIAASLKNIPLQIKETPRIRVTRPALYMRKDPSTTAPILEVHYGNRKPLIMTQSFGMLEFLEETYPSETRLIPPVTDMAARSKAMDLALLVACEFQPMLSYRILKALEGLSFDEAVRGPRQDRLFTRDDEATRMHLKHVRSAYTTPVMIMAMKAYEGIAKKSAGKFSVGDNVSIADICLVPLIQSIQRSRKIEIGKFYPTISRIMETCEGIDAFRLQGVPPRPKEQETSQNSQTDDVPQADHSTATAANS